MANTCFLSFFSCFMSYAPFFTFEQGYLCRYHFYFILFWYFYYNIQFFYIVIFSFKNPLKILHKKRGGFSPPLCHSQADSPNRSIQIFNSIR